MFDIINLMSLVKAKVALVSPGGEVLVLVRSDIEESRPGGLDWPGGKADPGDTSIISTLIREVSEELPGTVIDNIRELDIVRKQKAGQQVSSHLFAATAIFPSTGIKLSEEHSDYFWVPIDEFYSLDIPNKYKRAIEVGSPLIKDLVEVAQLSGEIVVG